MHRNGSRLGDKGTVLLLLTPSLFLMVCTMVFTRQGHNLQYFPVVVLIVTLCFP